MAGGTFTEAGKVRPGTYINFISSRNDSVSLGKTGTVLIPLIGHDYGPAKTFITVKATEPEGQKERLGYSVFEENDNMLLIREALKNAGEVIVYIPNQGEKAKATSEGLTVTAMYGGVLGNSIKVSVVTNPVEGFDVTVYLGVNVVSKHEGVSSIEQLTAVKDPWVEFSGTGELTATPSIVLSGGTTPDVTAKDITDFLDVSENVFWNTMAFPVDENTVDDSFGALCEAVSAKVKYLAEEVGKYRTAVVANFSANYEHVINVTNSVVVDGKALTAAQATAWVAGADASADPGGSLTYKTYEGATSIVSEKNHAESVAAINKGEFFFSASEGGNIKVEYDINSLTDFSAPKDETYSKNRVMRVFNSFGNLIMSAFAPNKFDNNRSGLDVIEGIGRTYLKSYYDAGYIKDVDYDKDFVVDRGASKDDSMYITVGLCPVQSSEKLYFTIKTR